MASEQSRSGAAQGPPSRPAHPLVQALLTSHVSEPLGGAGGLREDGGLAAEGSVTKRTGAGGGSPPERAPGLLHAKSTRNLKAERCVHAAVRTLHRTRMLKLLPRQGS